MGAFRHELMISTRFAAHLWNLAQGATADRAAYS
jgi:hypothetical protein